MSRILPRAAEAAIRTLKTICEDPKTPVPMRARSAELILSAYGLVTLSPEQKPRHPGVKALIDARLDLSAIDAKISGQVRQSKADQRRLAKILNDDKWKKEKAC